MKEKKRYLEGYLTVEATFIIPIVVMIIGLLLYWGFYCYDKSVSLQCSYLAALRGSNEWEQSNNEVEQLVAQNLEQLTEETVLYMEMEELDVQVGLVNIEAEVSGAMDILFSKLRGDTMTRWNLNSKKSAHRLKPSSYIRKYQLVGE